EPAQRRAREHFEVRRVDSDLALDERDDAQLFVQLLVGDRHVVPDDALVHLLQVRARVTARRVADTLEQLADHARRAGLAVGAGEVDRGVLELRRAQVLQQRADALECRRAALTRAWRPDARLQVDVAIEPGTRLAASGEDHAASGGASSTSTRSSAASAVETCSILPASPSSPCARASAASRSAVSCTTTWRTGVISERRSSDFFLRTAASTSAAAANSSGVAPARRRVAASGHWVRWIVPSWNQDHTSSVT